jgi:hypothetical protein
MFSIERSDSRHFAVRKKNVQFGSVFHALYSIYNKSRRQMRVSTPTISIPVHPVLGVSKPSSPSIASFTESIKIPFVKPSPAKAVPNDLDNSTLPEVYYLPGQKRVARTAHKPTKTMTSFNQSTMIKTMQPSRMISHDFIQIPRGTLSRTASAKHTRENSLYFQSAAQELRAKITKLDSLDNNRYGHSKPDPEDLIEQEAPAHPPGFHPLILLDKEVLVEIIAKQPNYMMLPVYRKQSPAIISIDVPFFSSLA